MMIVTTWFGTFLLDEGGVVKSNIFPKNAGEIAHRMKAVTEGSVLEEERMLAEGLRDFMVTDQRLTGLGGELVEGSMPDIDPGDYGFSRDLLHEAMMVLARGKAEEAVPRDESIAQAVAALDDLTHTANLLSERLREWYGLHHPGQTRMMKDEDLIGMIMEKGPGEGKGENHPDLAPISELAQTLSDINSRRKELENFITGEMESKASNISHLVGPVIGARLIAKAGGLSRLSKLPSGTIQMLGAEKAMFRHLSDGSNPPKHGLIFQQPLLHRAPYWQRGKIARAMAAKIAIAAKVDEHSGEFIGEELKKDLLERIDEIRQRYPDPPVKGRKKR